MPVSPSSFLLQPRWAEQCFLTWTPLAAVQLPAHFTVWLASPEAAFLNGRTVWANWDVEELKNSAGAIQSGQLLTSGINGWPYTSLA